MYSFIYALIIKCQHDLSYKFYNSNLPKESETETDKPGHESDSVADTSGDLSLAVRTGHSY